MSPLAKALSHFLYQWHFASKGIWRDINPRFERFSARSHMGLIALLRISVPAIEKDTRSVRIAEAIREAGYAVIEDDAGVYIERCSKPAAQHPDEDSRPVHSTSAPLALASN